jgi:serine/threonine protein kinase
MPAKQQIYCPNCFRLKPGKQACIHPDCKFSEEVNRLDPLCLPYRTRLAGQRYITGKLLGRGEYSAIYLCLDTDPNSRQIVAIKEYLPWGRAGRQGGKNVVPNDAYYSEFGQGLRDFEQESEILRSLMHENILRHQGYFRENGSAYIVSNYCDSVNLEEYFKTHSNLLSESEALRIFLPVLNALDECHRKGIIHCDINPRNIQIAGQIQRDNAVEGRADTTISDYNGSRPIIIDFGSAQFNPSARKPGRPVTVTPGYSSPEQYERDISSFGPWTDIYGCAATLYRLTTGRIPLAASDRKHKDKLTPPKTLLPSLNEQFASAIKKRACKKY